MILFLTIYLAVLIIIFTVILFCASEASPKKGPGYPEYPVQNTQNFIPENEQQSEVRPYNTDIQ